MLLYMLDTDFCSHVIRKRSLSLLRRFEAHESEICVSTVVLFELLYGAAKSDRPDENRTSVDRMMNRLTVLDWDAAAAHHAGDIRAELGRAGQTIGPFDVMIAGHARSRGLIVVTGNGREVGRVDGLRHEDWTESTAL